MSQPRTHPSTTEGLDNLLFAVVIAMLCLGALVWATGELSGFLTSGRWPGASFSDMGRVLLRLSSSLQDPSRAWPRPAGDAMSGPVVFYAVFFSVLVGATGAALGLRRFVRGATSARGESSSGWAAPADLRMLVLTRPERGRLVLGRVGRKLVAAEKRQSVIVLGPTQSMKTSGFAIPSILEWDGPVVATSVKSDLMRDTLAARSRRGPVSIYDPTRTTGQTQRWSPLHCCCDWRGAQRTAAWLAGATGGAGGLADSEFWYAASAKLLAPLLFAAASSGATMADVVRWINTQEESEVRQALARAGVAEAIDAASASFNREGRQKSSVFTTAETVMAAFEDPVVAASAAGSDITPERVLASCSTLYVCSPSHEQRRLRPLFETLLHTVIAHALELSSRQGRPLDPPLLIVLDEAANIAPLRDLDTLASTAAGHGIQLVSVFQDLAQISTRYGDRAHTVVNNHRAKIILSGISDTQTLEYASRLLGDEEVLRASVTRGVHGGHSTTESVATRSLAPANVLRSIRPGEGVLVYGHLPPARLLLRPWFKDKHLRAS